MAKTGSGHILLNDIAWECDEDLKTILKGVTTMVKDLVKFGELSIF
jgi:hypothetical protein